jgi:hypothetical protein
MFEPIKLYSLVIVALLVPAHHPSAARRSARLTNRTFSPSPKFCAPRLR